MDELGHLIVRIEAAWIGQHPDGGAFEGARLPADRHTAQPEGVAVGADTQESDDPRRVAAHLLRKPVSSLHEFLGRQLGGGGGAAIDQVGDAVAAVQELILPRGVQLRGRKPGAVKRGPESVAGTGKVVAGGDRHQARVDADEQDLQARRDDVADSPAADPAKPGG